MASIASICKKIIVKYPFYGLFLLNFQKVFTQKTPTISVTIKNQQLLLLINEDFWNLHSDTEQVALVMHELYHVCFMHLTTYFDNTNPMLMNIAMDAEINQYIPDLPDGEVTLEALSNICNTQLPKKAGTMVYYKALQKVLQNTLEELLNKIKHNVGDHSLWPNPETDAEHTLMQGTVTAKLVETAEQCMKLHGTYPGELGDLLSLVKQGPIYNWKNHFRQLVGNSISSDIYYTRQRPNRRFPDARGMKFKLKPNILIGMDTSGSISKEDLQLFFSEIFNIWKTGINVTIVECDTKIQKIIPYKGQYSLEVKGRGGTELHEVIEYYKAHKNFSACIMFTDGYCNTDMPACHNLIWIITKNGRKNATYSPGHTIFMS